MWFVEFLCPDAEGKVASSEKNSRLASVRDLVPGTAPPTVPSRCIVPNVLHSTSARMTDVIMSVPV